jgi:two-component system sensor histidine kinase CreC
MIDMTLALAAVEHRQAIEQPESFDLVALARDVAGEFETLLPASGVSLRLDAPDLPIRISGDRFLVGQAIRNLLQNAQEFSARGAAISLSLRIEGGHAVLAVCDEGPGVAESLRAVLLVVAARWSSQQRPGTVFRA